MKKCSIDGELSNKITALGDVIFIAILRPLGKMENWKSPKSPSEGKWDISWYRLQLGIVSTQG